MGGAKSQLVQLRHLFRANANKVGIHPNKIYVTMKIAISRGASRTIVAVCD